SIPFVGNDKSRRNSDAFQTDLLTLYQEHVEKGRNNTLFYVACVARDRGVGKVEVVRTLANAHALQPAQDGSKESFQGRYAEAIRTIDSVYSRPARPQTDQPTSTELETKNSEAVGIPTPSSSDGVSGLLNSVREWLLKNGCTAAARMLDGLLM